MKKLLFVDDEVLLALEAEVSLRAAGYDVTIAFSGEEALEKAVEHNPDLVLTDYMMPKLDGAGLVRELAVRGITAPVVVLTAVPEADLAPDIRDLFAAYLGKPVEKQQLLSCISTMLV
ncbi:MAG TPA: response regulator [Devosia sp.]|nr:response regulator [Devosia sp.]